MPFNKDTYAEIGRKLRELPPEESEPSYEWEELVENLCSSDDSGLHDIGLKELDELKQKHALADERELRRKPSPS